MTSVAKILGTTGLIPLQIQHRRISLPMSGQVPLIKAENVDIDNIGAVSSRFGYSRFLAEPSHSLKSISGAVCLVVINTDLCVLYPDFSILVIKSGITSPLSYWEFENRVYLTGTNIIGYVSKDDYSFNELPVFQEDNIDGIPSNLVELYYQTKMAMPAGELLTIYQSRLYVASGNMIYVSDPLLFHIVDKVAGFIQCAGSIRMLYAIGDGIYVSDDTGLFFLKGKYEEMVKVHLSTKKAIKGSAIAIDPNIPKPDKDTKLNEAIYFLTEEGICLGGTGGVYKPLTSDKHLDLNANSGAMAYRRLQTSETVIDQIIATTNEEE